MLLDQFQLLPALRARWPLVLATWGIVVALVLAVSLAFQPRYEATATLAVEMGGADPIRGQTAFKPAGAVSTHIATQVDILQSEQVALGASRILGFPQQREWQDDWRKATGGRGDFESWVAGELLRKLDVRPARDSNVIRLSYTSDSPESSAAIANAFVRSYVDTTLEMQVGPARKFNAFFAERSKPLKEALEQARSRLSAYEKEHGIVVGDQPDVESARLGELSSQLVQLQDQAAEAANVRRQARAAPGDMREVRNDPEVSALTADLVRQQGQLAEVKSEFGERHHAVIQAQQSLGDTRRRLDAAMRRAAESLGVPSKVIDARIAGVQAAIERQRALVLQRKSQRDAAGALLRDVEGAQKAYSAVLERASQTALESANTTQSMVSILKSATPPVWSPKALIRNLTLAALLGLLLGIARALIAEARDRRLRTVEDVTRRLRQPFLLALPDDDRRGGERSEQTQRRLVSSGTAMAAPQ